ncbi:MAG: hypothetical protein AB1899_13505 [Pseudomonadota bacterium]
MPAIAALAPAAFGPDEGPVIVQLLDDLMRDATARPAYPWFNGGTLGSIRFRYAAHPSA